MFNAIDSHRNSLSILIQLLTIALLMIQPADSIHASEVTLEYQGLTLNANLELAPGRDLKDGIVLIVHGYLAHNKMEIIRASQQALLDNGQGSLAINLSLGIDNRHGFYECTDPHRHTQENAVDELKAWVEWLRDKGVTKITMMGHSRGANQIMVYAVEVKDPEVTRLVMLAPGMGATAGLSYKDRYGKSFEEPLALAFKQVAAGRGSDLMADIDLLSCPKARVSADSFISYYGENNKFRQFTTYLPRISIPTLIVIGTLDDRQPNAAEIAEPLVDDNLIRLGIIEGAGHFFRDFNSDEAMEMAVEFINE
jgi:pimeloyl-ACP methyl ester carboxylesterase